MQWLRNRSQKHINILCHVFFFLSCAVNGCESAVNSSDHIHQILLSYEIPKAMLVTASRARSYEICAFTCRFPCFHVMFPVDVLTDGGCGPDLRSFYSQVHGGS